MARVAGFVPSEAKGKRNAVKRYIISNCPYYSKNERTSKTEAKKKRNCVFAIPFLCDLKAKFAFG